MAVKLHRCGGFGKWIKFGVHPCWKVEKALQDQGVAYEPVYGPTARSKRADVQRLTGQSLYPVIEFEDGSSYREESKQMAETIRSGQLDSKRGAPTTPAA